MKKKILSIIAAILVIMSLAIVSAFASDPDGDCKRVHLSMDDPVARSGNVTGTHKIFGGSNSSDSRYSVYFIAQYSSGSGWSDSDQKLVAAGKGCPRTVTTLRADGLWRLELNPKGATNRYCSADGWIEYDMS